MSSNNLEERPTTTNDDDNVEMNASVCLLVNGPTCTANSEFAGAMSIESESLVELLQADADEATTRNEESTFGAKEDPTNNTSELQDIIASPLGRPNGEDDKKQAADIRKEYGYRYEYTTDDEEEDVEDDEEQQRELIPKQEKNNRFNFRKAPNIYVLGRAFDAILDHDKRTTLESCLFWFTYRFDFPEIVPYNITTDAGWGCMLRSAQMLLCQALRVHFFPNYQQQRLPTDDKRQILTWFADYPSKTDCIFSLHNMVAAGMSKYDTLPGEWYGPGTAAHVLRDLCRLQEDKVHKEQKKNGEKKQSPNENQSQTTSSQESNLLHQKPIFRIHVAQQGTIYRDSVQKLMTRNALKVKKKQQKQQRQTKESNDDDPTSFVDPLSAAANEAIEKAATPWETALLLLVPLRLGLKHFEHQDYGLALAHTFSLSQSVGILGGRPRGARWFYGAASDGSKLYALDPHFVHPCPERLPSGQVKLAPHYVQSVHCKHPECMPMRRLDPSLTLGFYCRNAQDFDDFCNRLETHIPKCGKQGQHSLITIADCVPDYSANVSSVMHEMMSSQISINSTDIKDGEEEDDDDEYVFL